MGGENKTEFRPFVVTAADASEAVLSSHPQPCVGAVWELGGILMATFLLRL